MYPKEVIENISCPSIVNNIDAYMDASMTTTSVLQGETQNNSHSMANRRGGVGMAVSFGMAYQ